MSPFSNVMHVHADGQLLHGTDNLDAGGGYHDGGYHNAPVLGWYSGDDFYLFIDWLKYDDGTPISYELGMIVGKISTRKGSLYLTVDGKSWVGPTAVALVLATPTDPVTIRPSMESALTFEQEGWPATYHFQISPMCCGTVMHVHVDGSIVHGVQDVTLTNVHNQPVLGTASGDNFYIATDFTKDDNGQPIFYELMLLVGHISTREGSAYNTTDGMSWTGPMAITLIPV